MNVKAIASSFLVFCAGILLASAEPKQREWNIDGVTRQALVSIPDSIPTNGCPLIFAFHGHGGSAANAARMFHYHEIWPEAAVVYMQGLPTPGLLTDPEGKRNGWDSKSGDPANRDLKFFDAVLSSLRKECRIDPKRIYCTGHSNGGGFTYFLWAERGDVFAAIAPSAAVNAQPLGKLPPLPVMHIAGKSDDLVKYEWQEKMMRLDRQINKCSETGMPWVTSGELNGTIYASEIGAPFIALIHPGGHIYPQGAPELIVRFFKEHARM